MQNVVSHYFVQSTGTSGKEAKGAVHPPFKAARSSVHHRLFFLLILSPLSLSPVPPSPLLLLLLLLLLVYCGWSGLSMSIGIGMNTVISQQSH